LRGLTLSRSGLYDDDDRREVAKFSSVDLE
jgi:hypothetical protein